MAGRPADAMWVPSKLFLTKGRGVHREKLLSFEMALRDADIAAVNLVRVSSILPPRCKIISRREGAPRLRPGAVVHAVIAENATAEPNRLVAASIGVAQPRDPDTYGYLSEHHSFGETATKSGDYAEDLAASLLATSLGVAFDPDDSWDEKRELWRISGQIVRTREITQTARGDKHGRWTTVVAAAVLLD